MISEPVTASAHLPLALVRHRVAVGVPLPFDVFMPDTSLLLARGQVVHTEEQLDALMARGSLVAQSEFSAPVVDVEGATREQLPGLWADCMKRVGEVLRCPGVASFRDALDGCTAPVEALIRRDPDLAIFQVLRQENHPLVQYGLNHSVHTAIVAHLVATRLGWQANDLQRAFRAALTMNIAIVELQGRLAEQREPPTAAQRQAIHDHPRQGRALLEQSGIADRDWLLAVEQHHEERGGQGYPAGVQTPSELATLLHRADGYCAKLSSRATREAGSADLAGREIFMQDPGHPVCAALVKELGVYPPGCFVTLASGETAIVVKRGATVMTPIVAALTTRSGAPLPEPLRRDTMMPLHAIVGVVAPRLVRVPVVAAQLAVLAD